MATETEYQTKPRAKAVMTVYLIVRDYMRGILIARRYNTGYEDGNYNFPSGHVEEGESPTEAVIRETEEEIGKVIADELRKNPPRLRHVSHRPKHDQTGDRIGFFFVHETVDGPDKVINGEPDKCDDLKWVYADQEFPENFAHHERHAFKCIREGKYFSELDLDWLKERGLYKL